MNSTLQRFRQLGWDHGVGLDNGGFGVHDSYHIAFLELLGLLSKLGQALLFDEQFEMGREETTPYEFEHLFGEEVIVEIVMMLACFIMPLCHDLLIKNLSLPLWFLYYV